MQKNILMFQGGETSNFLQSLLDSDVNWQTPGELDISSVKFITPLIGVLIKALKTKGWTIISPKNNSPSEYLKWMVKADISYGDDRYIPILQIQNPKNVPDVVKKFSDIFKNWVNKNTKDFIEYSLGELMDNVFHHANSKDGLFIHVQKYEQNTLEERIEVCIADLGIGIYDSMAKNPNYFNLSIQDRFLKALQVGETSKPDRHTGEGLSSVLEWLNETTESSAIVISKECVWYKGKNKEHIYYTYPTCKWPGTLFWASFPRNSPTSIIDVWNKLGLYSF